MKRNIILASSSQNRKVVMDSLNIPYKTISPDVDERAIRDENFSIRAEKIARTKAEKVLNIFPRDIIISGDSFAVYQEKVFEKPADFHEARQMLQEESGGSGVLYAGFCYIDLPNNINFSTTIPVEFSLLEFDQDSIEWYLKNFPVLTWSGAFFPGNPYCAGLVREVRGSLSAFVYGFPFELVTKFLRKSNIGVKF